MKTWQAGGVQAWHFGMKLHIGVDIYQPYQNLVRFQPFLPTSEPLIASLTRLPAIGEQFVTYAVGRRQLTGGADKGAAEGVDTRGCTAR